MNSAPPMLWPALPVVLASTSPQRKDLLGRIVAEFRVEAPGVEEGVHTTDPVRLVEDLAEQKAEAVRARVGDGAIVIGADTVACCEGEIIGKPADTEDAVRTLMRLSRHPHAVLTGLCVLAGGRRWREAVETRIRMRPISRAEAERYAGLGGATERAGAYAIQEQADECVEELDGSVTNVIGLPLERLAEILLCVPGTRRVERDAV
jgi:septum formation protein